MTLTQYQIYTAFNRCIQVYGIHEVHVQLMAKQLGVLASEIVGYVNSNPTLVSYRMNASNSSYSNQILGNEFGGMIITAVTKLGNSIDLMEANSITKNDDRYRKKCDMMVDAKAVLDDSEFIDKCQLLIKRTIVEYACETRDSTIKWWQLILIGAMFASFAFNAYNNNIIIKNQKVLEKNQTTNTNSIMNNNQKGDKQ